MMFILRLKNPTHFSMKHYNLIVQQPCERSAPTLTDLLSILDAKKISKQFMTFQCKLKPPHL